MATPTSLYDMDRDTRLSKNMTLGEALDMLPEPNLEGFFNGEAEKAIQQNHVYIIESDLIDRGGPRLVDALEEVATDIHPGLFEGGTQNEASIPQSPGFGVIPLTFAFLAVLLIRLKR